jgi:hypothetical protein
VVAVSEDQQPDAGLSAPVSSDAGQDVMPAKATRLGDIVVGRLADQARLTAQGAKARRVASTEDQPGMADLTPLRELLSDLVEEMRKVKPRERIARTLRQAADIIDPPASLDQADQGQPRRRGAVRRAVSQPRRHQATGSRTSGPSSAPTSSALDDGAPALGAGAFRLAAELLMDGALGAGVSRA